MAQQIQSKHVKSSGPGEAPAMKKDGYASGPVPPIMRGSKPGKTDTKGYSGPNVARGTLS